jgi:hypothetical protein
VLYCKLNILVSRIGMICAYSECYVEAD